MTEVNTTKKTWWISSTGEGLSLTIKGFLIAILPGVLVLARLLGVDLAEADFVLLIDLLAKFVAGAIIAIGVIRKILIAIKKRIDEKQNES